MTNRDSLRQPDRQHDHHRPLSPAEVSRRHLLIISLGLTAILATTATVYYVAENLQPDASAEVIDPEAHLRLLAREAILRGPDSPDDIISTCNVAMDKGAYKAMYDAVGDAIRKQKIPEDVRDKMDLASYVSIETSAVMLNETLRDTTSDTTITLFYKDIDNDNTQEILGSISEKSPHAVRCRP